MEELKLITWQDFEKVELRVGTIIQVEDFPNARKAAYKLKIDFGKFGIKCSSAQITHLYNHESLLNKQILAVINFPKKQIADFMSECLVTGLANKNGEIVLLSPDTQVPNGSKLI